KHIETISQTKSLNLNQKKILGDISRKLNLINNNIHINILPTKLTAFKENKDKIEESKEELTKKSSSTTKREKSEIQTKKDNEDGIDKEFLNQLINANKNETTISRLLNERLTSLRKSKSDPNGDEFCKYVKT